MRFYYIERLKTPICTIITVFASLLQSKFSSSNFIFNKNVDSRFKAFV